MAYLKTAVTPLLTHWSYLQSCAKPSIYIYIYVYIYTCVCVCVFLTILLYVLHVTEPEANLLTVRAWYTHYINYCRPAGIADAVIYDWLFIKEEATLQDALDISKSFFFKDITKDTL